MGPGAVGAATLSGVLPGLPGAGLRDADLLQHRLELVAVRPLARVMIKESGWQRPYALRWSGVVHPRRERLHQAGVQALPRGFVPVFRDSVPL